MRIDVDPCQRRGGFPQRLGNVSSDYDDNVAQIVAADRARGKIENENNKVLKNQGYHFDHNFGHGKQHLPNVLATY